MPELKLDNAPPVAVKSVPLIPAAKVTWHLKATYPAPLGTVWARYSETKDDSYLEVITLNGKLLQRLPLATSPGTRPPLASEARYLEPARARSPLLYLKSAGWHHFWTFPDGFAGFLSETQAPVDKAVRFETDTRGNTVLRVDKGRRTWSGVDFREGSDADLNEGTAPRTFPFPPVKGDARFVAAVYDRVYFLRWVKTGEKARLEVWDKTGKRLAVYPLGDTFGARPHGTFIYATWLDEHQKRGPVIVTRDSDQVRVHVFTDGMRRLLAAQDFSDFSTSQSATTASLDRDKNGILTVTESYSQRPEEGETSGASSEITYYWNGKGFSSKK